jgi:hypothetical protein
VEAACGNHPLLGLKLALLNAERWVLVYRLSVFAAVICRQLVCLRGRGNEAALTCAGDVSTGVWWCVIMSAADSAAGMLSAACSAACSASAPGAVLTCEVDVRFGVSQCFLIIMLPPLLPQVC